MESDSRSVDFHLTTCKKAAALLTLSVERKDQGQSATRLTPHPQRMEAREMVGVVYTRTQSVYVRERHKNKDFH